MNTLLLVLLALLPLPQIEGVFTTDYGRLELCRMGPRVFGFCRGQEALDARRGTRLWGTQSGERLSLHYSGAEGSGEVWFELGSEGQLRGRWTQSGRAEASGAWNGERLAQALPMSPFSGLWKTNHGYLRLAGTQAELVGVYDSSPNARLRGKVLGESLRCRFTEDGAAGQAEFELSPDGRQLTGRWRLDGAADDAWQPWNGTRVEPVPGKVWLVILEARWERSLREREYAFADMLAEHFSMGTARHVQVRGRSFHDAADFVRFAREVNFLAEPVLLVVSSHGTPEGILVGTEQLDAELVAGALRPADHLLALHLSGCSLMRGEFPQQLHEALGATARWPISGYTTDVAWNASAIADYLYLSLILIERLAPSLAARQAHQLAPFTGETISEGLAFPALGLRVLD